MCLSSARMASLALRPYFCSRASSLQIGRIIRIRQYRDQYQQIALHVPLTLNVCDAVLATNSRCGWERTKKRVLQAKECVFGLVTPHSAALNVSLEGNVFGFSCRFDDRRKILLNQAARFGPCCTLKYLGICDSGN